MNSSLSHALLEELFAGDSKDPHRLLGMHPTSEGLSVRVYNPQSVGISLIDLTVAESEPLPLTKKDDRGLFEIKLPHGKQPFPYLLEHVTPSGHTYRVSDPYAFVPSVSDYDLYLFNEGKHHKAYEKLGCHLCEHQGVKGASFTVWAPSALRVSVVGSFNQWDGRTHSMRLIGSSGVWELFIPGLASGDLYKFEIKTPSGELYIKADPYAFFCQKAPNTASVVWEDKPYAWSDRDWLSDREKNGTADRPVNIYEVHLGSWKQDPDPDPQSETGYRPYSYRRLADTLIPYAKSMGYTHLELLPIMEHPFDGSWGYQVLGYYAPTSRYGDPDDFKYFVDNCHANGLGVLLDWVPAHFPKDGHGLARFDGTPLYEHGDKRQGEHLEWGTHIFNYGRSEVRNFLISNAIYWFDRFHIDGLRVDAVSSMLYLDYCRKEGEWLPNPYGGRENLEALEFIRQLNALVYSYYPNVMMIAEEATSYPLVTKPVHQGGLGFSHKWNMGWMNDFLKYMSMDSVFRKDHQNLLTFSFMYAWSENYVLVLSHDEVVHGKRSLLNKMPGDYWQKFAGLRAALGYFYGHPGKKLLFMGGEFGQFIEWKFKEALDWHLLDYPMHEKLHRYASDLNHLYLTEKALHEVDFLYEGFEWIDCNDTAHSVLSFIRKGKDWRDMLLFIYNFTPALHDSYRVGAPLDTTYSELFNSDSEKYGGSNGVNAEPLVAENVPFHNKPFSLTLKIPPLSCIILRPDTKKYRISSSG